VRQGDIISPKLFNIMMDAAIQDYDNNAHFNNMTIVQFYADNGFIALPDHTITQHTLDALAHSFAKIGLQINTAKTESMTMVGSRPIYCILDSAYNCMITRTGLTCEEKKTKSDMCKLWIGGSN
jgi:Reverse transcriptase (RNA-dependent DNA polymerase)